MTLIKNQVDQDVIVVKSLSLAVSLLKERGL